MYATGVWSVVYALDAKTGKELWTYDPQVPRDWGRYACCDAVNRGVALWKDALYFGTLDGRLVSLDARTGKKRWEINTIDRTKPYTITGAPRVVKGKVLIGNGGGEYGVRGYFSAYDADTGKLAWRFYTVPGQSEGRLRKPGDGSGREDVDRRMVDWAAAAARCGTRWRTTRTSTRSTSAPATARRGRARSARRAAATTCTCRRSSRSTRTPGT